VLSARVLSSFVGVVAALMFIACGSSSVQTRDYGEPPDASQFNPGNGSGGDGYGSGGSGSNAGTNSFVCPPALRACAETFTLADAGYSSVELRGDCRVGAWTSGDAMTKAGTVWSVTVPVPLGQPVQYKFFVDGTTWLLDPANSATTTDDAGSSNSLDAPITCASYTCS
jgi:hypothetical protein